MNLRFVLFLSLALVLCHALRSKAEQGEEGEDPFSVIHLTDKERKINDLESKLTEFNEDHVEPATKKVHELEATIDKMRSKMGWFPNEIEKQKLQRYESELLQAKEALQRAESTSLDLLSRLKPLYGIWSREFYDEQSTALQKTFRFVGETSYNQAWWEALFSLSERESLVEVLMGFFLRWLMVYLVMYPFAGIYFLLWSTPRALWAYSSSLLDIPVALVVWCIAFLCFLVPLVLILGALFLFVRNRVLAAAARRADQRYEQSGGVHYLHTKRE